MKKKNQWNCSNLSSQPLKLQVFSFLTEDSSLTLHRLEIQVLPPQPDWKLYDNSGNGSTTFLAQCWASRGQKATGPTQKKSHHHRNQETDTVKSVPLNSRTSSRILQSADLEGCPQASVHSVMFLRLQRTYYCFIQNVNTVWLNNKHGLSSCSWKNHVAITRELRAALGCGLQQEYNEHSLHWVGEVRSSLFWVQSA